MNKIIIDQNFCILKIEFNKQKVQQSLYHSSGSHCYKLADILVK